jgi:hypothetical protein
MERIEPAKIDVAAIHHLDRSGLRHDQIERRGIARCPAAGRLRGPPCSCPSRADQTQ